MNISGKVVVITGASSGLGEATARYLAERGATVVLGARRLERLQALVDEITRAGGKASAVVTDVTDPYLNLFRRILPPVRIGPGALDLSPIIATFVLIIVSSLVAKLIRGG